MNNTQVEEFKKIFQITKQKIINELSVKDIFESSPSGMSGDEADQTAANLNHQLMLKLKGRETFYLKKIENALQKIEEGTFGECEDCGADISMQRLKARPTATLCINCKEEQEREENRVLYTKRSHTLGKSINSEAKVVDLTHLAEKNLTEEKVIKLTRGKLANGAIQ